jgi:uncharacterized membrane protein
MNTGASPSAANIVERVKRILFTPQTAWDAIAGEPAETNKLYTGYVLPLVVVSAVCGFIGMTFVGVMGFRTGLSFGLTNLVLQIVLGVAGVYVAALITNALAPSFGSQQDIGQAHKLAAYSSTAGLVAGIATLLPALGILALIGAIYSLVLLYIGLPRLMKTPEDKRIGYFATIVVVCIVLGIVAGIVLGSVRAMAPGASPFTFGQHAPTGESNAALEGTVTLPGGGSVDLGALQRQAEAIQGGAATVQAVDPAALQQRLPQSLPGGFRLTSVSSASAMDAASAEGEYRNGDAQIQLSIVHLGAMGALAGMAASANVQQSSQDEGGYSRMQTIDGRMVIEEVRTGGVANYSVTGSGFAVSGEGSGGATIDQVRAAVQAVGIERLERELAGGAKN